MSDVKPLYSWGSVDPGPSRYQWIAIDYPIHVGALPGDWNMYVQNAETGEIWLVPGMQAEEPAVERDLLRPAVRPSVTRQTARELRGVIAELTELAKMIESRANHDRGLSRNRLAKVRDYHAAHADAHDSDARLVRSHIDRLQPTPALRLVGKEDAHV